MLWGLLLMALNDRQQLFVEEYLLDLNATQAAIRAGYAESTADKKAPLWVGKSRDSCPENMRHVWDAVNEAKTARSERTGIDADYVLRRLVEIDQMDVADILQADGSLKAIQDWPKVWRQYIAGMDLAEMFEGRGDEREMVGILKKIKWPDKLKNLELLGKHIDVSAFKENHDHRSGDGSMTPQPTRIELVAPGDKRKN